MRVLVQKSLKSSVSVNGKVVGKIDNGLVLLVGFTNTDNESNIDYLVKKIVNLRIFEDELGVMNKSLLDVGGSILSISQFTLYADTKNGNRPSYVNAMPGEKAKLLYDMFNDKLREFAIVETGMFGEFMEVKITNNGPTTIMLER